MIEKERRGGSPRYRHNEGAIMEEIAAYINKTYEQHYSNDRGDVIGIWRDLGIDSEAFHSNIIKYAYRFGRKDGRNVADLFKIIHYTVLLINAHRRGDARGN